MNKDKTNVPLVSFVIPTHNRADVLRACLNSVVNQTYKNIEVIVVNDNSSDNTEEILSEYKQKFVFLDYCKSDGKGGNAARNFGIKIANGEYIAFMDDDDVCELDRIDRQMNLIIASNNKYNFIVSGFYTANVQGEKIKLVNYKKPLDSVGFPQRWLIKKDVLLKTKMFDVEQPALQDVEFFWRIKDVANILFDPQPVVSIRNSKISITKDNHKMIMGIKRLLDLHGAKMGNKEKNIWYIQLCKRLALVNNWSDYKVYFKKINKKANPFLSLLLIFALLFKEHRILKLHSKVQYVTEKILIKVFK